MTEAVAIETNHMFYSILIKQRQNAAESIITGVRIYYIRAIPTLEC
jgi:hypothetical protein